jgi:thiol:disulfide interchange protein DsbA
LIATPGPVAEAGRVSVVEFFWFGCPHCYKLEPDIKAWLQKKPAQIDFEKMPAQFGKEWVIHAQLYYTLLALDQTALIPKVFEEVNKGGQLKDEKSIRKYLAGQGVETDAFDAQWNSLPVRTRMMKANKLMRQYQLRGVPTFIVNGKYQVSLQTAGTPARLFEVIEFLSAKETPATAETAEASPEADKAVARDTETAE